MADDTIRLIARAWAAFERMTDGASAMPFNMRRVTHQAFYAGASVGFHLARKNAKESRANHNIKLEAIRAELEEWSTQFDTSIFGPDRDTSH